MSELTAQQRTFVSAYLGEAAGNATKAAIIAGYSEKAARQVASRLLTYAHIQHAIEGRLEKHDLRTDAILRRLGKLAYATPDKVTGADVIGASKVILQVNGALKDTKADAKVQVVIGFLGSPQDAQPTITAQVIDVTPQVENRVESMTPPASLSAPLDVEPEA